jgi:hypothetical protein
MARDGQHIMVAVGEPHGDVWLVKNFAKMWKK